MTERVCDWAMQNELEREYHDKEWGQPLHDDRALFELLMLEGMQAGISWLVVLKKREALREAFDGFIPEVIAGYGADKLQQLQENPAIIRNRLKIAASVGNAKAFLAVQQQYGSFDRFLWSYVDGKPIVNHYKTKEEVPASTPLSERLSKDLKKLGFRFVGPVIVYSFMQAAGMVNDHLTHCWRHADVQRAK